MAKASGDFYDSDGVAIASSCRAFVGLGSNLADPKNQVRNALNALRGIPNTHLHAHSSLYSSTPMGPADQPDFVNAAAELFTGLAPLALLDHLQAIEMAQGRVRVAQRWGPRAIDLDLLLFDELEIDVPRLKLPHAGAVERDFVLVPLAELDSTVFIPGHGTVATCLSQLQDSPLYVMGRDNS
ncbi:MAG: 2-amino-4-hydroxy-6-hydroxymethyldihydropteridine diphosphokinase [Chromatiales bacterium]|jgi:2-amino-4-hydroxy-6-hydroxymethyldihydropteridine diphosphokinase|nr:2-amino-4-hydroxy-6-hydroxymethyldihydropteridine diphosphokinase [Chromatiales bacterium]